MAPTPIKVVCTIREAGRREEYLAIAGFNTEVGLTWTKQEAISIIKQGGSTTISFYCVDKAEVRANLTYFTRDNEEFLRTDRDTSTKNNLLELPIC